MSPEAAPTLAEARAEAKSLTNHLGMWTFLATEILFFGGFFIAYTLFRGAYPEAFRQGGRTMDFWLGTLNTAILLTSSFFMAIADRAVRGNQHRRLTVCLVLTALLGCAFLAIKAYEYHGKYVDHLIPGAGFHAPGSGDPREQIFFFLYFGMTGLHALHMLAGLAAMGWLLLLNQRRRLSSARAESVAIVGLYWHFVDCIWVFLYPLFYLAGR
jgi:cytochrome c oxidase subunit III